VVVGVAGIDVLGVSHMLELSGETPEHEYVVVGDAGVEIPGGPVTIAVRIVVPPNEGEAEADNEIEIVGIKFDTPKVTTFDEFVK
jgi:hypothetical protein